LRAIWLVYDKRYADQTLFGVTGRDPVYGHP